jgi:hypothetical protein
MNAMCELFSKITSSASRIPFASTASLLTTWQQPLLGFVRSFIGARMVVKGTASHFQRLIIKERLEGGRTRPAWWMYIFPFLHWRFDWERDHWHGELEQNQHTAAHRVILALCIGLLPCSPSKGGTS